MTTVRKTKTMLMCAALAVLPPAAGAHDFAVSIGSNSLYFNITDTLTPAVTLTYEGSIADGNTYNIRGAIELPAMVRHGATMYAVTAIGAKAFAGDSTLTAVVMPSTVTSVGDFAFEGCTSMEKIVFPGKDVKMGQGVFFRCTSIRSISFGSDWHDIDLQAYRWSDSLTVLRIPAKVGKLRGMKSLRTLATIDVDTNNQKFSSYGGALYDKDGKTLYGVPRSYRGALRIKNGTESVLAGALIDCPGITKIDIPATLTSMSFRETSRMEALEEVIFRGANPPVTAYAGNDSVLLMQVANDEIKVTVPKDSKKAYASRFAVAAGEYSVSREQGSIAYPVSASQLPSVKNINGIKDIDSYE